MNKLRTFLILLTGIPACAALAVGTPIYIGFSLVQGEPISRADWMGAGLYFGFASLVLWIALRVSARVRGGDGTGLFVGLARRQRPLIAIGALLGAYASYSICTSHARDLRASAGGLCARLLDPSDPRALAACEPVAFDCQREERRRTANASFTGEHIRPDFDQRPEVLCLRSALHLAR